MVPKDPQKSSSSDGGKRKGFWDKTEQVSRIFHNFADGSFKLIIIIAIVIALVLGIGVYSKTTSGIQKAKNWTCEYINPFCDTESEAKAKAEKSHDNTNNSGQAERPKQKDESVDPETGNQVDAPGFFERSWIKVKAWFDEDEPADENVK